MQLRVRCYMGLGWTPHTLIPLGQGAVYRVYLAAILSESIFISVSALSETLQAAVGQCSTS